MIQLRQPLRGTYQAGKTRRRYGARSTKKLLLLDNAVIAAIQRYQEEAGITYFNHAVEDLVRFALRVRSHLKRKGLL